MTKRALIFVNGDLPNLDAACNLIRDDDFIIAVYLAIGLIFLFKFRGFLFKFNQTRMYMFGAIIFAIFTILMDMRIPWLIGLTNIVFDKNYLEDATKVFSEYFLLLSFIETYYNCYSTDKSL